jgi:diguanylate cyclase (GGDEF)-like protein
VTEEDAGSATRPRVLLLGDPSARPSGLERALTRAGFQLVEPEAARGSVEADAVIITLRNLERTALAGLLAAPPCPSVPRIVVIATSNRDAAAVALELGAADALTEPIHLPELCARLHARLADRHPHPVPSELVSAQPDVSQSLEGRMRQELERARRYSLSFSLVLLGVDELRSMEERGGPAAADRLRDEVVDTLRRELRLPDFVVPHGGSEFAILLPETDQAGARQSVLRIRDRLNMVPSERDPRLDRPRFSAGIASYPHPAVTQTDELLALAEAALVRSRAQAERIGMAI